MTEQTKTGYLDSLNFTENLDYPSLILLHAI